MFPYPYPLLARWVCNSCFCLVDRLLQYIFRSGLLLALLSGKNEHKYPLLHTGGLSDVLAPSVQVFSEGWIIMNRAQSRLPHSSARPNRLSNISGFLSSPMGGSLGAALCAAERSPDDELVSVVISNLNSTYFSYLQ